MAGSEAITLYNTTDIEQTAYTQDGKRYSMAPHEVRPLPRDIAEAFLMQRSKFVQTYQAVYIPPSPGESVTWIANATGNPFQPDVLKRTKLNRQTGIEDTYEVPNPLRTARPVEFTMNKTQRISESKQGGFKESFSLPPETVKIPPTTRVPVPRSVAEWLLRRDAQMEEGFQRSLVECRGPSDFEPNESWSIEEMLLYAEAMDAKTNWKKHIPKNAEEHDKKLSLFRALFFRLIDESYALVDRTYFQGLLAEQTAPDTPVVVGVKDAGKAASGAGARV